MSDAYGRVEVTSAAELRVWLAANHASSPGVWLVTWKKSAGDRHVGYEEVVRECLCFGWIDSLGRKVDDQRTSLLVTPRNPSSKWSRPNKERIADLDARGLLAPAGRAAVELAKASGTWTALDDVENLVEPDDLAAALNAVPSARAHWDAFPRTVKRATLAWIGSAKRPATRARRVSETVKLSSRNVRPP